MAQIPTLTSEEWKKELATAKIRNQKSLLGIHARLKIKQSLKIYTANTNKKYLTNFLSTEILDDDMYELVYFNTLGKLKRHHIQLNYIRNNKKMKAENQQLKLDLTQAKKRNEKAIDISKKDNLKNAYIECLEAYTNWNTFTSDKQFTLDYLTKIGIKYAKYMKQEGIDQVFSDRIDWFKKELSK